MSRWRLGAHQRHSGRPQHGAGRSCGLICPDTATFPTADIGPGEKRLSGGQNQAIFTPDGTPLGVCRAWHVSDSHEASFSVENGSRGDIGSHDEETQLGHGDGFLYRRGARRIVSNGSQWRWYSHANAEGLSPSLRPYTMLKIWSCGAAMFWYCSGHASPLDKRQTHVSPGVRCALPR